MTDRIIAIGASSGGIPAITQILQEFPAALPAPVFVVQHLGRASGGYLPAHLAHVARVRASHPADGEPIASGHVYVAPPDHHMLVERGRIRLSRGPEENFTRPAIDALFRSAALAYGADAIGIVLTGYLRDGTSGLLAIKDRGGIAIVQDPAEATTPEMPRSALASVPIDYSLQLRDMGSVLGRLIGEPVGATLPASPLVVLENLVASGQATAADLARMMDLGIPIRRRCPLCNAPMVELSEHQLSRLRCARGHAYTDHAVRLETQPAFARPG